MVGAVAAAIRIPANPPPVIVAPEINGGWNITAIRGHVAGNQETNREPRQQKVTYRRE